MSEFGKRVQERREALGWTPSALAAIAGLSARQVRNIETGRTMKSHQATVKILEEALARGERKRATKLVAVR